MFFEIQKFYKELCEGVLGLGLGMFIALLFFVDIVCDFKIFGNCKLSTKLGLK